MQLQLKVVLLVGRKRIIGFPQLLIWWPNILHRMPRQTGQKADEVMVEELPEYCCDGQVSSNNNNFTIACKHCKQMSADSVNGLFSCAERAQTEEWKQLLLLRRCSGQRTAAAAAVPWKTTFSSKTSDNICFSPSCYDCCCCLDLVGLTFAGEKLNDKKETSGLNARTPQQRFTSSRREKKDPIGSN